MYGQFTKQLHAAFVGTTKMTVQGRDSHFYEISGKLESPDIITSRVQELIDHFRKISQADGLFLKDFDTCWKNQIPQIKKYIFDGVHDGNMT